MFFLASMWTEHDPLISVVTPPNSADSAVFASRKTTSQVPCSNPFLSASGPCGAVSAVGKATEHVRVRREGLRGCQARDVYGIQTLSTCTWPRKVIHDLHISLSKG